MELIGRFGFHSSLDTDKFDGVAIQSATKRAPLRQRARGRALLRASCGPSTWARTCCSSARWRSPESFGGDPMSYAYYHKVKGGKTPAKASSFEGDAPTAAEEGGAGARRPRRRRRRACATLWRCTVCGHIEYVDELPADFTCPLCGMGADMFEAHRGVIRGRGGGRLGPEACRRDGAQAF